MKSPGRQSNRSGPKRPLTGRKQYLKVLHAYLHGNHLMDDVLRNQLLGLLRNRNFVELYRKAEEMNTGLYKSPSEHFAHVQFAALVLKYPWSHKEIGLPDPRETAIKKFREAEEACRKTNLRFSRLGSVQKSRFFPLLEKMRSYIYTILGEEPDMESIYAHCNFGSGASIGVTGTRTSPARKLLAQKWTCTQHALPHVIRAIWSNDQIASHLTSPGSLGSGQIHFSLMEESIASLVKERIDVVTCNKVSFVPKTAKTHRAIAVEPLLLTFIQKGIDAEIRGKLRTFGVDLTDQSKNADLARIGSITGTLGTLDLSSASDTVARQLVYYLLPYSWFRLLNSTRSHGFMLRKGHEENYEKFSSMGNGFCFPLETLIFLSAVKACNFALRPDERRFAVYGDDIVTSTETFPLLVALMKFLGFKPNSAKTFYEGPFRESCGADWYGGQDVRPVYLDYHLADTSSYMIFHNATLRSHRTKEVFSEVRDLVRSFADDKEKLLRPDFWSYSKPSRTISLTDLKNLNGAFTVPLDIFMASRSAHWDPANYRWKWKEFLFTPNEDHLGDTQGANDARYIAFLSGSLGGKANLRYEAKRRIIVR